jgi:hypothetical protein
MRTLAPLLLFASCLQASALPHTTPSPFGGEVPRPEYAAPSTFQLEVEREEGSYTGTAWIHKVADGLTYLITAGHLCGDKTGTFELVTQDGRRQLAYPLDREVEGLDLCEVATPGVIGPPLLLAPGLPVYGAPVAYVGAPQGIWGDGMAPLYHGFYAGGDILSILTAPGASGSAILGTEGVIGVLVAVATRFPAVTWMVPVDDLRVFLASE